MPRGPAKERFALYLPGPMLAELDAEKARTGTEVAELIRRAVDFYLAFKRGHLCGAAPPVSPSPPL